MYLILSPDKINLIDGPGKSRLICRRGVTPRKEMKLLQVGHSIMAGGDSHERLRSHYTVGDEGIKTVSNNYVYKILRFGFCGKPSSGNVKLHK